MRKMKMTYSILDQVQSDAKRNVAHCILPSKPPSCLIPARYDRRERFPVMGNKWEKMVSKGSQCTTPACCFLATLTFRPNSTLQSSQFPLLWICVTVRVLTGQHGIRYAKTTTEKDAILHSLKSKLVSGCSRLAGRQCCAQGPRSKVVRESCERLK